MNRANQPTFKYPKEDPVVMQRLRRPFLEWLCNFGLAPATSITQLVLAGVFERFPKLKIFFAETRLGWVPFWLEHMDLWYQRHLGWAEEYLGFKPLKEPPGHYVRQNIYFSVQYIENEWPNSRRVIDKIYADIPEPDKRKIWAGNAVEFFKLAN